MAEGITFCICGATIEKRMLPVDFTAPDGTTFLWFDSRGDAYCYPDADNDVDRFARHVPESAASVHIDPTPSDTQQSDSADV